MTAGGTVRAQAKVNLFLRVLAREGTGHHQIETLFCRLALADVVTVRVTRGRSIRCTGDRLPPDGLGPDEQNLAWRAAVAFAEATGFPEGFAIEVEKHIPVGGGLGGGSADAGAVLRILNALCPHPLSREDLAALAGGLGADVPFLTQDASPLALAWGRGDRLLTLPHLPTRSAWLHVPGVSVSTADAYRWLDESPPIHRSTLLEASAFSSWPAVIERAVNDFQAVVASRVPEVGVVVAAMYRAMEAERLGAGAFGLMSGTGSTVVVLPGELSSNRTSGPVPLVENGTLIETSTATFVERVVRTH